VFLVAGISAGASLAIVYYYSVVGERWLMGMDRPHLGTVDAILLSMPAVVYVLGLSGAIHLVNYYRDERDERGLAGAVERSVRISWAPCALAAFTTAVGLGSLAASDIVPIMKFGAFTAAGVLVTIGVLFTVLPVYLHAFPPRLAGDGPAGENSSKPKGHNNPLPRWAIRYRDYVTTHPNLITGICLATMAFMALGLPQIRTSVQLLKLLDPDVKLIHDYAWLEKHLGNLVPMEVVVGLAPDHLRTPEDPAEGETGVYRMTMHERMRMAERLQHRIEKLPEVSRAMSAATFAPEEDPSVSGMERRIAESTTSRLLEDNREELLEYMRAEITPGPDGHSRELWRVSARVAALADIDYGHFVGELREAVEPVLDAYRVRDKLVASLQKEGKPLQGSQVCVAYLNEDEPEYKEGLPASLLVDLLNESEIRRGKRGGVVPLNVAQLAKADEPTREATLKALATQDAVVAATPEAAAALAKLAPDLNLIQIPPTISVEDPSHYSHSDTVAPDSTLAAVYTGIVPLVYKTQRELLKSLRESIGWATLLIAGVMVLLFRTLGGGLVSMIPNVFPIVIVFGALGWLGINVDIGIMMTASVALGVAVDDTIHFLTWFRRGVTDGLDRQTATRMAFERCGVAMTQTTLIAGLGLAVFATSTFTPTQQFGTLMITILSAALVGDLVMLPALLCGPLGWFFAPKVAARPALAGVPYESPLPSVTSEPAPATLAPPAMDGKASQHEPAPQERHAESLSASNAALHAKLKKLRRQVPPDGRGS
jgi:predicted RND superfamily exporter protein